MAAFRKVGEREVYRGSMIRVAVGRYAAPDGTEFERDLVHHPGAVSIVPVDATGGAVLLVRQYRSAIDRELLEIPAGRCDVPGEPPEATARRELEEEVGMHAGRMEVLAEFFNTPGFCDEHCWVFMALDLAPVERSLQGIEEQHMTVEKVALDDVPSMIADGTIMDGKTIIGLTLARQALA